MSGSSLGRSEALAKQIVSPTNDASTLGTMIAEMAATPIKLRMTLQPKAKVDPDFS